MNDWGATVSASASHSYVKSGDADVLPLLFKYTSWIWKKPQLISFREYFIFNSNNITFNDTPIEFPPAITVSFLAVGNDFIVVIRPLLGGVHIHYYYIPLS